MYKYNLKTGKKKLIKSSDIDGKETAGFSYPTVKGKYVYLQYNEVLGSSGGEIQKSYICRINIKNGKMKKLGLGENPVVIGNRIYYNKVEKELIYDEWWWYPNEKKKMSMKLDGKNKKKESSKKVKFKKRKFRTVKFKVECFEPVVDKDGRYIDEALYIEVKGKERKKLGVWFMP